MSQEWASAMTAKPSRGKRRRGGNEPSASYHFKQELQLFQKFATTILFRGTAALLTIGVEYVVHEALMYFVEAVHLGQDVVDILNRVTVILLVAIYLMLAVHTLRELGRLLLGEIGNLFPRGARQGSGLD